MFSGIFCVSAQKNLSILLPNLTLADIKHTVIVDNHPIEWMGQGGARHGYRFGSYGCRCCSTWNGACELLCVK